MSFENKVAIVTGGSRGIGRAIVQALAREGAKVAFTYVQNKAQADEIANGDSIIGIQADVVDFERAKALVKEVKERFGRVDILVNNAGITRDKLIALMSEKDWDDVIDTNLKGAFFLSKAFGRYCLARGRPGCIVSLGSTHGIIGIAQRSVYGISKAGIIHMTKMLAIEWAERNIRVNAIAPTTVLTPSREKMLSDPEVRQGMLERIPTRRFATPEEVAGAVVYLASPAAASVTGHTLLVDGGLIAC